MSPRAAVLLEEFGFEEVWDYVDGKMDWLSRGLAIEGEEANEMTAGIMALEPAVIDLQMSPNEAVTVIDHSDRPIGVVVADGGVVVGLLTREAADKAADGTIESAMESGPKTYRANGDPAEALDYMNRHDVDQVVVSGPRGKLIGLLYRDVAEGEVNSES